MHLQTQATQRRPALLVTSFVLLSCLAHSVQAEEPQAKGQLPRELWDVSYIAGKKVGRLHTKISSVKYEGRDLIKIEQQGSLSVARFDTPVTIGMTFSSLETPAGELVAFRSTLKLGPQPNVSQGVVKDGSLLTKIDSLGKQAKKKLDWNPEWGGFFEMDRSLRSKPMTAGEKRTFKALMPLATDVALAEVSLAADDYELTELLEGKRELLKIDVTMQTGDQKTEQTIWTDKQGEVLKGFTTDMGGMTTYRTSREIAMRKSDDGTFDLGKFSTVRVGKINNAHNTKQIVYRVKLKNSDPREVFAKGGSQQVDAIDERTADVTVTALRLDSTLNVDVAGPQDEDRSANNLIQSDDRHIQALAQRVLPDEDDKWQLAVALENAVFKKMTIKNFSTAFATAAEVARSLEGDCTEHAVLLAALCRAREIPARVAIGLVYYPPQEGFAFHMWNEVWIKDRWVPLDATLGRGGIGAAHLKLTDSSLAGADSFSAFLPVAKVLGQLEIEVQDVK